MKNQLLTHAGFLHKISWIVHSPPKVATAIFMPMKILKSYSLLKVSVAMALTVMAFGSPGRAQILWQSPAAISGEADVLGSPYLAYNFGEINTATPVTVSGFWFNAMPVNSGTVDPLNILTVTSDGTLAGINTEYNNSFPTGAAFSKESAYAYLFKSGIYATTASASLTLTLSYLTPGTQYQVQLWVNDTRNYGNLRNIVLSSPGGGDSDPVWYNQQAASTLGNYIVGTFTAGENGLQEIFISGQYAQINAMTLSIIPEPAAWLLMVGGLALLTICRYRQRKTTAL
jgi:hypothetical protein